MAGAVDPEPTGTFQVPASLRVTPSKATTPRLDPNDTPTLQFPIPNIPPPTATPQLTQWVGAFVGETAGSSAYTLRRFITSGDQQPPAIDQKAAEAFVGAPAKNISDVRGAWFKITAGSENMRNGLNNLGLPESKVNTVLAAVQNQRLMPPEALAEQYSSQEKEIKKGQALYGSFQSAGMLSNDSELRGAQRTGGQQANAAAATAPVVSSAKTPPPLGNVGR
jgi:hypothetical protein